MKGGRKLFLLEMSEFDSFGRGERSLEVLDCVTVSVACAVERFLCLSDLAN